MLPGVGALRVDAPRGRHCRDDESSSYNAFPFTVWYYGVGYAGYTVQTNGMLQLWPSAAGAIGTREYNNSTIPNSSSPNTFLAPFWADLNTSISRPSIISALTVGVPPNRHFTVQWLDLVPRGTTMHLQFQVHIYETGAIEYHYCSLESGTGEETGLTAAVGIEDHTGRRGVLHTFRQANAVSTSQALRFAPVP